ncbi:hypothetical protein GUJ93_ZPchr0011g27147 [Zizania palustris]|uniref:Uncharacterized protein n=1 Tax=Zizania palustris TaxID=103762 RepID=A0A8J5WIY1_ZIZPA|nr:hypothetical protein GUJ93_ZPchr0011g27147 [Zizania palustris]
MGGRVGSDGRAGADCGKPAAGGRALTTGERVSDCGRLLESIEGGQAGTNYGRTDPDCGRAGPDYGRMGGRWRAGI